MLSPAVLLAAILFSIGSAAMAQGSIRHVLPGRETRQSKLLSLGQTDRWLLKVHKGERLWCQVSSGAFDPVLELVDSDGEVLGSNDGEGTSSALWLLMEHDGPVEFRVRGYRGSGGGNYNYVLQRYRTQELAADGEARHNFGREQWWHYLVTLQAGDVLVPTVTGHGRLTAVFDMEQQHIAETYGGYRAPRDGRYFVRVEGQEDHGCQIHCQLARQRALPEGGELNENMGAYGFDVWRIRLEQGRAYAMHVRMAKAQFDYDIRERIAGRGPAFVWTGGLDKGGSRRGWLVARRDCELELLVRNRTSSASPYRLSFGQSVESLLEGQSISTTLTLGGGDVFELPTTPGQLLRVRLTSDAFDGQVDLWDPEGAVVAKNDDAGPLDRNPDLTYLVTRPGCHRLLVFSPGGCAGGDYQLQVESIPIPVLELDRPLELQVAAGSTTHCHVHLAQGQGVWLSVRSSEFDTAVTVLQPAGRAVGTWEGGGIGTDALAAFRAPAGGRYTLLVHSRSGAGTCRLVTMQP